MSIPAPLARPALIVAFTALAVAAAGCGGPLTDIALTDAGNRVRVLDPVEMDRCEKVGTTTVKTIEKYAGIFPRKPMRVDHELEVRARNEAPTIEGNAIVPAGPSIDGERKYLVFRCP